MLSDLQQQKEITLYTLTLKMRKCLTSLVSKGTQMKKLN